MRKIFRSLSFWIVVLLCAIIVILYFCGFRITYAPMLNNHWEAISAGAGWFGAIMSALALFAAIGIPKSIAEQQNKIALFDKRYYAFSVLNFLLPVAKEIINNSKENQNNELSSWKILASSMQAYKFTNMPFDTDIDFHTVRYFYTNLVLEAVKIDLLFNKEETSDIVSFLEIFDSYVSKVCEGDSYDEEQEALQSIVEKIVNSKIQDRLEEYLKL